MLAGMTMPAGASVELMHRRVTHAEAKRLETLVVKCARHLQMWQAQIACGATR